MTVSALAQRWECSRKHIYALRNEGKLEMFLLGEKRGWRITDAEVMRFEKAKAKTLKRKAG